MSGPNIEVTLACKAFLCLYNKPDTRYIVLKGGRGSGKSIAVADRLIFAALNESTRILCAREYQKSIKDSVHALLRERIGYYGLDDYFDITQNTITCKITGTDFIFAGVATNVNSIKSMTGVKYVWIEEGDSISQFSLDVLIPTFRMKGTQFFIVFNPVNEDDPIMTTFVKEKRDDTLVVHVNFTDNVYFKDTSLAAEEERMRRKDPEKHAWVWLGETRSNGDANIFKGRWEVKDFEIPPDRSRVWRFGLDFGFSQDISAAVKCTVIDNKVYITDEWSGLQHTIDQHIPPMKALTGGQSWPVMCDSARPESIAYLKKAGINAVGVEKGKGSVEDGIEFLKSFDGIVVHAKCQGVINELRKYQYKIDKSTGQVLPIILDANNHFMDALRYAFEPEMKGSGLSSFLRLAQCN